MPLKAQTNKVRSCERSDPQFEPFEQGGQLRSLSFAGAADAALRLPVPQCYAFKEMGMVLSALLKNERPITILAEAGLSAPRPHAVCSDGGG